jgi:hypothetical protein
MLALVMAGLVAALVVQVPTGARADENGGQRPTERTTERPADGDGRKASAEEGAQKSNAEGSQNLGSGGQKPGDGSAQKPAEKPDESQKSRLVSILGRELTNREGDGGRVIDVLVDLDGRSGAVVVEFGGFMGIGSRKVAVDWGALRFVRDGNRSSLIADVTRDQIRDAPEYKPNEPPTILTTK